MVRAVQAIGADARAAGLRWLLAAQACGLAFLVFKLQEYGAKFDAGIDLETNRFYMFFILTGFHFFHVLAAMVFLAILTFFSWRGDYGRAGCARSRPALPSGTWSTCSGSCSSPRLPDAMKRLFNPQHRLDHPGAGHRAEL